MGNAPSGEGSHDSGSGAIWSNSSTQRRLCSQERPMRPASDPAPTTQESVSTRRRRSISTDGPAKSAAPPFAPVDTVPALHAVQAKNMDCVLPQRRRSGQNQPHSRGVTSAPEGKRPRAKAGVGSPHDAPLPGASASPKRRVTTGAPGGYARVAPQGSAERFEMSADAPFAQFFSQVRAVDSGSALTEDYMVTENLELSLSAAQQSQSLNYSYSSVSTAASSPGFDLNMFLTGPSAENISQLSPGSALAPPLAKNGITRVPSNLSAAPSVDMSVEVPSRQASRAPPDTAPTTAKPLLPDTVGSGQSVGSPRPLEGLAASSQPATHRPHTPPRSPRHAHVSPQSTSLAAGVAGEDRHCPTPMLFDRIDLGYFDEGGWSQVTPTVPCTSRTVPASAHGASPPQSSPSAPNMSAPITRAAAQAQAPKQKTELGTFPVLETQRRRAQPAATAKNDVVSVPNSGTSSATDTTPEQPAVHKRKSRPRPLLRASDEQPSLLANDSKQRRTSQSRQATQTQAMHPGSPRPLAALELRDAEKANAQDTQAREKEAPLAGFLERLTSSKRRSRARQQGGAPSESAQHPAVPPSQPVQKQEPLDTSPRGVSSQPSYPAEPLTVAAAELPRVPSTAPTSARGSFSATMRPSTSHIAPVSAAAAASTGRHTHGAHPSTQSGSGGRQRSHGLSALDTSMTSVVMAANATPLPNASVKKGDAKRNSNSSSFLLETSFPEMPSCGDAPPSEKHAAAASSESSSCSSSSSSDSSTGDSSSASSSSQAASESGHLKAPHGHGTQRSSGEESGLTDEQHRPYEDGAAVDDAPLANLPTSARRLRRRVSFADEKHMPLESMA